MGNCISCFEGKSSQEEAELRTFDGGCRASGVNYISAAVIKSDGMENTSLSNGSRTPASSSHRILSLDGYGSGGTLPNSVTSSQKSEKKAFYSRIPPLVRSGSTDKKSSTNSLIANASIKDNNNAYSESKISALYELYKDSSEDAINAEGIEMFCKDLELKPEDFRVLILAWKFGAEQMCRFTREEFHNGMRELKTDTIKGIQARLPDLVKEVLSDSVKFKDLYRFAFKFALDVEIGQRILPTEMACSLWRVVFSKNEPPILSRWLSYLELHPHIRGIPKDTWNMFLNFVDTVGNDLSAYDDTEAWPSLFDDFVEYENDRLNQNTISITSGTNATTNNDAKTSEQMKVSSLDEVLPSLPISSSEFRVIYPSQAVSTPYSFLNTRKSHNFNKETNITDGDIDRKPI